MKYSFYSTYIKVHFTACQIRTAMPTANATTTSTQNTPKAKVLSISSYDCPQLLELPVFIYGCNNIALVVSFLIDSEGTYSFTSKSLVKKT